MVLRSAVVCVIGGGDILVARRVHDFAGCAVQSIAAIGPKAHPLLVAEARTRLAYTMAIERKRAEAADQETQEGVLMRMLNGRVLVEMESAEGSEIYAKVVAVAGSSTLKVGDRVVVSRFAGMPLDDGSGRAIYRREDVFAVVNEVTP